MIDTLLSNKPKFIKPNFYKELNLTERNFIMMTLHRPANVDQASNLRELMREIMKNSNDMPIIFPVHPRTKKFLMKLV